MRPLLCLLIALLLSCPVMAQLPPLSGPVAAAPDTVAALHRLFAHKRKKLAFILLGTATAELTSQVVIGTTVEGGGIIDGRVIGQFAAALLAVPVVLGEVLFYAQYNQKHEQRAVDAWRAHQLSPHLKRQLKAKYFH